MNKFDFRFLVISICLLMMANPAFAWDAVGHKLTTHIAWERMTPEVRENVIKILLDAPEDSDLSVHYDAFNSRSSRIKKRELFMYASIWPDVIRNRKFDVRHKNYHQGNWHYADIFWKQEKGKAVVLADFREDSGKAIPKLYDFEKILRDSSYSNEEKAIALAWFLHVGGDIHNPVHNGARVTTNSPKGDQGGNRFTLRKSSGSQSRLNLHSYWDSIIGNVLSRKKDACDSDYLAPIARKLMKKYPYSKMQNRLEISNYKKWNLDGFNLLNEVVYKDLTFEQMPSKKYRKRAFRTASEQIALAGYRLGDTLNQVFSQKSEVAKQSNRNPVKRKDINEQSAIEIWEKVKSVIGNKQPFKFIRVDIKDTTVILNGIIASAELKKKVVDSIKKLAGVGEVVDNLKVDPSLVPDTADNELKMTPTIPAKAIRAESECKIIRKVLYPVSKRRSPEQKMRIALLDICPPNKGMVARPMTSLVTDGEFAMYEYDVTKVFADEAEAKQYAKENKITDVSYK